MDFRNIDAKTALVDLIVAGYDGFVTLPKPVTEWKIKSVRAVHFFDSQRPGEPWNDYVHRVRKASASEDYCEWVRDREHNMHGILVFYTARGQEIKMKHFTEWEDFYEKISNLIL